MQGKMKLLKGGVPYDILQPKLTRFVIKSNLIF